MGKEKKNTEKVSDNKKKFIGIGIAVAIFILFIVLIIISTNRSKEESEHIENITFFISSDYEYFDVSLQDFYDVVNYKFKESENIASHLKAYNKDGYQYLIELSNGDNIYVKVSTNEKVTEVKYDYIENISGKELVYFTALFTKRVIRVFDESDFNENYVDKFIGNEETFSNEKTVFVYDHLLSEMNIRWDKEDDSSITSAYLIFKPIKENTEEEYMENYNNKIENEKKEKDTKEKQKIYFNDENIRWGMSGSELESIKDVSHAYREYENADGKIVYKYADNEDYEESSTYSVFDAKERGYWFYSSNNKLNSYMIEFYRASYVDYSAIKEALVEKYGQPAEENFNFNDETYKNDLEKSLTYDYLNIRTRWINQQNFDILIQWGEDMATLTYCEKGYGGNY